MTGAYMLNDIFISALVAIALILLIIDGWPALAGTPVDEWKPATDCAEEDVPIIERLIDE
jgi:hypothetical protein